MPKNRIHKGKDGRYSYQVMGAKKLEIRSRKGESKRDFTKRCDALDKEAEVSVRGPEFTSKISTFSELFSLWLQNHVRVKLSPAELRIIPPIAERYVLPFIGGRRLEEITRADVYQVLSQAETKGLSASSIQKIRSCISRPYNWAINTLGLPLTAPTQGLVYSVKRQASGKDRYIDEEDYQRLLAAAEGTKYYNLYRILYNTGLRPSEALGLQVGDIAGGYLQIRRAVTLDGPSPLKTSSARRNIPISKTLESILQDQVSLAALATKERWLFPSAGFDSPSMSAVMCALKRTLRQTAVYEQGGRNGMKKLKLITPSINLSLYDFRHTFATRMVAAGLNPTMLQAIMGHEDITTTLKYYAEVTDEMEKEALDILENLENLS